MERVLPALFISALLAGTTLLLGLIVVSSAVFGFVLTFVVLVGTGLEGLAILILFFPTTTHVSLLLRRTRERKLRQDAIVIKLSEDEYAGLPKDRPRLKPDWKQVAANGAVGGVFALLYFFESSADAGIGALTGLQLLNPMNLLVEYPGDSAYLAGFVSSIASAASDTASHEVGVTTRGNTFAPIGFRKVAPGTIGGVSLLGSLTGILALIVFVLVAMGLGFLKSPLAVLAVILGGIVGNASDSILGYSLERKLAYWTNDTTNFISTALAGLVAFATVKTLL